MVERTNTERNPRYARHKGRRRGLVPVERERLHRSEITPETARNYFEQNIHLATQIVNLLPQVFPGARTSTSRTATWSVSTTSRDGSPGPPRASGSTRA